METRRFRLRKLLYSLTAKWSEHLEGTGDTCIRKSFVVPFQKCKYVGTKQLID